MTSGCFVELSLGLESPHLLPCCVRCAVAFIIMWFVAVVVVAVAAAAAAVSNQSQVACWM